MLQATPENTFVFYSFEAILSGLLVFVLAWMLFKRRSDRSGIYLTFLLASLLNFGLAFFLCSSLNFYEFYDGEQLLGREPEEVACGFFLLAILLLGVAFRPPASWKGFRGLLIAIIATVGAVHLLIDLLARESVYPAIHPLVLSMAPLVLIVLLLVDRRFRRNQLSSALILLGFSGSFLFLFASGLDPGETAASTFWLGQHLTSLTSLGILAYVIESDSGDLFLKVFIRLNLTFILLAGFIIVVVAGLQRQEYLNFADREAQDLIEFVRGHAMYFHGQGQSEEEVLTNPEINKRIVADFGNIPELQSVIVRLNQTELGLKISSEGMIERMLRFNSRVSVPRQFEPVIEGKALRLSAPIYGSMEIAGWVELRESLTSMNKGIAHQILIIFSAFTTIVILSGIAVGIIVTQADTTIRQQYEDLEKTHQQLLQASKLAALGEMAGGVAHEINNPLGVIFGRADYLHAVAKRRNHQEYIEDLQIIQKNAGRAARIISDLLDFARHRPLNRDKTDLNKLVQETIALTKPRVASKGLTLTTALSPLPMVEIDRDRIQQVLVNLINNAVDACQENGAIHITTEVNSKSAIVTVEDTGQGISDEHLKKIFDPFFTTKETGTGLGLSVSYSIIRDHGGEISVRSEPGRGACFKIRLLFREINGSE